jgi:hypothetical protein
MPKQIAGVGSIQAENKGFLFIAFRSPPPMPTVLGGLPDSWWREPGQARQ